MEWGLHGNIKHTYTRQGVTLFYSGVQTCFPQTSVLGRKTHLDISNRDFGTILETGAVFQCDVCTGVVFVSLYSR